jgi:hypothetical protein
MRKLPDAEVLTRADSLKKRHRSEWCRLVYEASSGRSMQEVADLLEYSRRWVREHLDRYAIESASGGGGDTHPLVRDTAGHGDVSKQVREVVKQFAPAEPDEDYVAEYEAEGHTPEVAKCLANAYEAGENAIEAGVIQETVTKQNERAAQIFLPQGTDWEMRLRRAVADVKSAAGLLDRAKITDLKRAATRKYIAAAHAKWMEQIERIENFHPAFSDEVLSHEA